MNKSWKQDCNPAFLKLCHIEAHGIFFAFFFLLILPFYKSRHPGKCNMNDHLGLFQWEALFCGLRASSSQVTHLSFDTSHKYSPWLLPVPCICSNCKIQLRTAVLFHLLFVKSLCLFKQTRNQQDVRPICFWYRCVDSHTVCYGDGETS